MERKQRADTEGSQGQQNECPALCPYWLLTGSISEAVKRSVTSTSEADKTCSPTRDQDLLIAGVLSPSKLGVSTFQPALIFRFVSLLVLMPFLGL